MNRVLYLADPWFDRENLKVSQKRLHELALMFENTLRQFFK
jgi:hypothetical protein